MCIALRSSPPTSCCTQGGYICRSFTWQYHMVGDNQSADVNGNGHYRDIGPALKTTLDQCLVFTVMPCMLKGPEM